MACLVLSLLLSAFIWQRTPTSKEVYEDFVRDNRLVEKDAGQVLAEMALAQTSEGNKQILVLVEKGGREKLDAIQESRLEGITEAVKGDRTRLALDEVDFDSPEGLADCIRRNGGASSIAFVFAITSLPPAAFDDLAKTKGPGVYAFDGTGREGGAWQRQSARKLGLAKRTSLPFSYNKSLPTAKERCKVIYEFLP